VPRQPIPKVGPDPIQINVHVVAEGEHWTVVDEKARELPGRYVYTDPQAFQRPRFGIFRPQHAYEITAEPWSTQRQRGNKALLTSCNVYDSVVPTYLPGPEQVQLHSSKPDLGSV
jgi:hypothetical protein